MLHVRVGIWNHVASVVLSIRQSIRTVPRVYEPFRDLRRSEEIVKVKPEILRKTLVAVFRILNNQHYKNSFEI